MRAFWHHTTKYDGSLHYRFPVEIIGTDEDTLIVYRGPDQLLETYRGNFTANMHSLQIFYRKFYHNIAIAWNRDWTPRMHYVNIATPADWNNERVTAVDMDLDLILKPDRHDVIVDDEHEFDKHIDLFHYPAELIEACRKELERLHAAMTSRKGIYDTRIFSWRPGDSVDQEHVLPL
ncbi:MAG: DUF402 domain-containing protein [Spirochaetales bacterium]|jgi:uncharacterized protein|nr:DUF402 domain-containing protein [Spirochaetales bacterium]